MNGNSLLLDTNIILYLLSGDQTLATTLDGKALYVSFITELELLGYPGLGEQEKIAIQQLLNDIAIIDMNDSIKKEVIELRNKHRIKLPDAIIAATSIYLNLPLFSADQGFENIEEINFIKYEL